jgi:hypothetical protein
MIHSQAEKGNGMGCSERVHDVRRPKEEAANLQVHVPRRGTNVGGADESQQSLDEGCRGWV